MEPNRKVRRTKNHLMVKFRMVRAKNEGDKWQKKTILITPLQYNCWGPITAFRNAVGTGIVTTCEEVT